jgi:hypothetical protein
MVLSSFKEPVELSRFEKLMGNKYEDSMRELSSSIYDFNFEVVSLIE